MTTTSCYITSLYKVHRKYMLLSLSVGYSCFSPFALNSQTNTVTLGGNNYQWRIEPLGVSNATQRCHLESQKKKTSVILRIINCSQRCSILQSSGSKMSTKLASVSLSQCNSLFQWSVVKLEYIVLHHQWITGLNVCITVFSRL